MEVNLTLIELQPENIFLDSEDRVKIGDFGLATLRPRTDSAMVQSNSGSSPTCGQLTKQCGTKMYTAPELEDPNGI